jgi:hypothetical protein
VGEAERVELQALNRIAQFITAAKGMDQTEKSPLKKIIFSVRDVRKRLAARHRGVSVSVVVQAVDAQTDMLVAVAFGNRKLATAVCALRFRYGCSPVLLGLSRGYLVSFCVSGISAITAPPLRVQKIHGKASGPKRLAWRTDFQPAFHGISIGHAVILPKDEQRRMAAVEFDTILVSCEIGSDHRAHSAIS